MFPIWMNSLKRIIFSSEGLKRKDFEPLQLFGVTPILIGINLISHLSAALGIILMHQSISYMYYRKSNLPLANSSTLYRLSVGIWINTIYLTWRNRGCRLFRPI